MQMRPGKFYRIWLILGLSECSKTALYSYIGANKADYYGSIFTGFIIGDAMFFVKNHEFDPPGADIKFFRKKVFCHIFTNGQ